jgi:hypothetical protein
VQPLKRPLVVIRRVEQQQTLWPKKRSRENPDQKEDEENNENPTERRKARELPTVTSESLTSSIHLFEDWMQTPEGERQCNPGGMGDSNNDEAASFEVVGIARQHYVFTGKPMRVFEQEKPGAAPAKK